MTLKCCFSERQQLQPHFEECADIGCRAAIFRRALLFGLIIILSVALTACNVWHPDYPTRSNTPATSNIHPDISVFNERVPKTELAGSKEDKTFIGVGISGGGSRAANFALATLWQLEQAGLLPPETVISSVSGGSLTAAYFALHGGEADWLNQTPKIKEHFRSDLQSKWVGGWLLPQNIFYYWLTPYDRSDIMKDVMDRFLLGPQNPPDGEKIVIPLGLRRGFENRITFSAIKQNSDQAIKNSGLSRLFLNATMLDGRNFVFTNEVFQDLGSSLSNYPLADAVMASGAFPGGFNCVTLEQYNGLSTMNRKPVSRQDILPFRGDLDENVENIPENLPHDWFDDPKYKDKGKQSYLHLMDGGASDNLGVRTLLSTIRAENNIESLLDKYDHCVLYLIDSYQDPLDKKWSRLVRSEATFSKDRRTFTDYFVDSNAMQAFDTLLTNNRDNELKVLNYPKDRAGEQPYWETKEIEVTGKLSCQVWHISIQRLNHLAELEQNKAEKKNMRCISRIANETVTAYRLDSPGIHDMEELQQNLFDAAKILIFQDQVVSPETGPRCNKDEKCFVRSILADQYEKWGIELKPRTPSKDYPLRNICKNIEKYPLLPIANAP